MEIYLPIAQMSVDILSLIALGTIVGLVSGLLGIGGAFLLSPILIFMGVPPAVAVASQANQIAASSFTAALEHQSHQNVDFKMGAYLLGGGFLGSMLGVALVAFLRKIGQADFVIPLVYVLFLGGIGTVMLVESVRTMRRKAKGKDTKRSNILYKPLQNLPFKILFRRARVYVSALLPLGIGFGVGILSALLGIGGGLVLVPAMIYILKMRTRLAVGTSTFQMFLIALNVTFLQAVFNQTVDIVLAFLLMVGGVVGAQVGATYSTRLKPYILRFFLAIIVLILGFRMGINLLTASGPEPANLILATLPGEIKLAGLIADFAHQMPALYGLTCCGMALIIGWLANLIFKKIKTYRQLAE